MSTAAKIRGHVMQWLLQIPWGRASLIPLSLTVLTSMALAELKPGDKLDKSHCQEANSMHSQKDIIPNTPTASRIRPIRLEIYPPWGNRQRRDKGDERSIFRREKEARGFVPFFSLA